MKQDLNCSYEAEPSVNLQSNLVIFLTLNCPVAVAALLANNTFLIALVKTRSLHIPSNMLLGALCIMDLLISSVLQPVLIYKAASFLSGSSETEDINWFWLASDIIFGFSFTIITLVSLDRYFAICHPFWYERNATCKTHIMAAIVGCIVFSIFFSLDFIIPDKNSKPLVAIGTTIAYRVIHILFPAIVFIFCYFKIYIAIRKQRRSHVTIGEITDSETTEVTRRKTERGKTFTILLIISCFLITYAPSTIWISIEAASRLCEDSAVSQIVSMWTSFMLLLSTIINPTLYYLRNKDVRIAASRIIKCGRSV